MKVKFFCSVYLLLFVNPGIFAEDIRIRLFYPNLISSVMISCPDGSFSMNSPGCEERLLASGENIFLRAFENQIWIRENEGEWYPVLEVDFTPLTGHSSLRFKPAEPVLTDREYLGKIKVGLSHGKIVLINTIDLEQYIMGAVMSEAGMAVPDGFYKVQAILCRTYAIRNFEKHISEGYNICDDVHCQAYKGMHRWNESIEIAVESTEGLIITDSDSIPVMTAFHSNSGGETQGSEKVWLTPLPYLKAVLDPFSVGQPNEKWEMVISSEEWLNYLKNNGFAIGKKPDYTQYEAIQQHREKYYQSGENKIEYRKIRQDWNLRSAFFSIRYEDGLFILKGKGYGHGVGLSQEGAINMARKGYHFTEILNFYFYNIHIIDYRLLKNWGLLFQIHEDSAMKDNVSFNN